MRKQDRARFVGPMTAFRKTSVWQGNCSQRRKRTGPSKTIHLNFSEGTPGGACIVGEYPHPALMSEVSLVCLQFALSVWACSCMSRLSVHAMGGVLPPSLWLWALHTHGGIYNLMYVHERDTAKYPICVIRDTLFFNQQAICRPLSSLSPKYDLRVSAKQNVS